MRTTFAVGMMAEARTMRMAAVAMSSRYVNPRSSCSARIGRGPFPAEIRGEHDVEADVARLFRPRAPLFHLDGVDHHEVGQVLEPAQEVGDLAIRARDRHVDLEALE